MNYKRSCELARSVRSEVTDAPSAASVVLISDDAAKRSDLRDELTLIAATEVVEAESGHEGLLAVQRYQPRIVIVDTHLPGLSGGAVSAAIARSNVEARVLLLAPVVNFDHLWDCMSCGAIPLRRDGGRADLQRAMESTPEELSRFHAWPIPPIDVTYADGYRPTRGFPSPMPLTIGQASVLDCLLMGISARALPAALGTTVYRARKDQAEMLAVLGVRRRVNAIAVAFERGWVANRRGVAVVHVHQPALPSAGSRGPAPLEPHVARFETQCLAV